MVGATLRARSVAILQVRYQVKATALYGRLKAEQREGKYFVKPQAVPFKEIAHEYLQTVDAARRRTGDDAARMHRWTAAFGDQDASTITPRQIERVLSDLQTQGKQPATERAPEIRTV